MPSIQKILVFANCDMTLIAWQADGKIPECRGFAIERQVKGSPGDAKNGFVKTYVGFVGQEHTGGEAQPSTVWPVQRYIWNDYAPSLGQIVRYRVVPMLGPAAQLTQAPQGQWSDWSNWIVVGTEQTPGFKAYFNRGVVGAQFLSRQFDSQADFTKKLTGAISSNRPNALRTFLSGPLRVALLDILDKARSSGGKVYAALYELNDPEIISALTAFGKKCNLILASGAFNKKSKVVQKQTDENYAVRAQLRKAGKINLYDRIVGGSHFAHNKFIVICDQSGTPSTLWTGSTNTTATGLCTQVNNGLLIEDATLATAYKTSWDELKEAGNGYPASLSVEGSTPAKAKVGDAPITAWNVPCKKFVDLLDAKAYIQAAKQGVLFLMFNPGTGGKNGREFSLLQDIQVLGQKGLYIHGVVNQSQDAPTKGDAGGGSDSTVSFTAHNEVQEPVSTEAITPHAITVANMSWFHQDYHFSNVMIHSKVIVVDPFGKNPVVMTGSHNMGPKASQQNDDNLVIIEGAPGLAQEYAVNILGVYGHYKWLYNAWKKAQDAAPPTPKGKKVPPVAVKPSYDGNPDNDAWQDYQLAGENLQLTQFLMGQTVTKVTPAKAKKIAAANRTVSIGAAPKVNNATSKKAVKESAAKGTVTGRKTTKRSARAAAK